MKIEISLIFTFLSVFFAIIFGLSNLIRVAKKENIEAGEKHTILIVKLEAISEILAELRREISSHKQEFSRINSELTNLNANFKHLESELKENKTEIEKLGSKFVAEIDKLNTRLIKAEAEILQLKVKIDTVSKKCKYEEYDE